MTLQWDFYVCFMYSHRECAAALQNLEKVSNLKVEKIQCFFEWPLKLWMNILMYFKVFLKYSTC